jgi:hypothetical protein
VRAALPEGTRIEAASGDEGQVLLVTARTAGDAAVFALKLAKEKELARVAVDPAVLDALKSLSSLDSYVKSVKDAQDAEARRELSEMFDGEAAKPDLLDALEAKNEPAGRALRRPLRPAGERPVTASEMIERLIIHEHERFDPEVLSALLDAKDSPKDWRETALPVFEAQARIRRGVTAVLTAPVAVYGAVLAALARTPKELNWGVLVVLLAAAAAGWNLFRLGRRAAGKLELLRSLEPAIRARRALSTPRSGPAGPSCGLATAARRSDRSSRRRRSRPSSPWRRSRRRPSSARFRPPPSPAPSCAARSPRS